MRIVVTLATLLAVHSGIYAGGLFAGDDAADRFNERLRCHVSGAECCKEGESCCKDADVATVAPAAAAKADCDTSVYHLEHAHAGQVISRVRSLIAQVAAYSADGDVAALPKSLIFLPTTSDDTIIAICPRAHAALVKHAIKSCDALKQYAVKVQLFEVADSGKTIAVGGPHLLIGREGTVQCTTPEESVSVNFKVDTPLVDANTEVPPGPSDPEAVEVSGDQAGAACAVAGRCRLDCPPPIGEMSVEPAWDAKGVVDFGMSTKCGADCCSQSGMCPACKTGTCTGGCQANGCKCDGSCCSAGQKSKKSHVGEMLLESESKECPNAVRDQMEREKLLQARKEEIGAGISKEFDNYVLRLKKDLKANSPEEIDQKLQLQGTSLAALKAEFGYALLLNECARQLADTCSQCAAHQSGQACSGTCCEACGCGAECCKAQCCREKCCQGQCGVNGCECHGTIGAAHKELHEVTSYEEISTCPASHCGHRFSVGFGFGTGGPGLHFVGPIVWFNKGDEPRCAACEAEKEVADSDDGHESEACSPVPPPPTDALGPSCEYFAPPGGNCVILNRLPAPMASDPGNLVLTAPEITLRAPTRCSQHGQFFQIEGAGPNAKQFGMFIKQAESCGSSCTDGCPILASSEEAAPSSPNAPCCCESEDAQQAPAAEPPALLTLVQHKDPASSLPAPHWQEELLKTFRGRRLSELFEPQANQTPSGHELGRLLAEFPKYGSGATGHSGPHSLTIIDRPDRVQIFQCDAPAFEPEKLPETAKTSTFNTCPNCREEFRAFLEEMFRGSDASEEIAQTSHHEGDHKATEAARDLPNVTHSKIETDARCYPLRDLVLCDDAGRPVFDTCTIIDHLQSAVAPESWSHPSVSIQLDQQSVSLVVKQTAEVHQKIADHLRYLRRLQVKQICNLIERMSGDMDDAAEPGAQSEAPMPSTDVELGTALPVGR